MIIYLSLLVCIVGLVIYAIASTEKSKEIGRLMFACGMLTFLFLVVGARILTMK